MKKFVIASALAIASLAATTLPSYADSVTVIERHGDGSRYHHRMPVYQDGYGRYHRDRCMTKEVRKVRHGRVIIEKTRFCR